MRRRSELEAKVMRKPTKMRALVLGLAVGAMMGALGGGLHAHAQAPADPTLKPPTAPALNAVGSTVTDAMKEAVGVKPDKVAAVAGAAAAVAASAAGAAGVAPAAPPAAADPAARAAALRRKALKDTDFIDSDESNRDPFKSFFRQFVDKGPSRVRQVPALFEKFALEELALIAVVSGDAQPRAMFRDPGGLGQAVKRGDYISKIGARITKILSDRVILEMNEPTANGEPRATELVVLLHPEEEARK
jgi:Tfp pilus assembly protein PilP